MTDEQKQLPSSVKVGFLTYDIQTWENHDFRKSDYLGICDHLQAIIKVDTSSINAHVLNSLIHEILHAIWHTQNLPKENEEELVTSVAHGLTAVFQDNPSLIQYLNAFLPVAPAPVNPVEFEIKAATPGEVQTFLGPFDQLQQVVTDQAQPVHVES